MDATDFIIQLAAYWGVQCALFLVFVWHFMDGGGNGQGPGI